MMKTTKNITYWGILALSGLTSGCFTPTIYTGSAPLSSDDAVLEIAVDQAPPTATILPASGIRRDIPNTIEVTFNENISSNTLTSADSVVSCSGSGRYSISLLSADDRSAIFSITPIVSAVDREVCTVTLSASIMDNIGNALSGTRSISYTVDSTSPQVSSLTPTAGVSTIMPLNITVLFSETMDATLASNSSSWAVNCSGVGAYQISSVSVSGSSAVVSLSQNQSSNDGETCTLTAGTAITDLVGNSLNGTLQFQFLVDSIVPLVSFNPDTSRMSAMPLSFDAVFSKTMSSATVTNASNWTVSCTGAGTYSVQSVSLTGSTATVTLTETTAASNEEVCTLRAHTNIQDSVAYALSGTRTSVITVDAQSPTVTFSPASSTQGSIPSTFAAAFSESMNASTVENTSNWSIACSGSGSYSIASVSLSGLNATVSVTQNTAATHAEICTLTAGTSLKDLAGNALSGTRMSAVTLDAQAPTVTLSPATGTRGSVPASVSATFSESMHATRVEDTSNWSVVCNGNGSYSVSGVSLNGLVATVSVTQSVAPANNEICTLSAGTAMQDLYGSGLTGTRTAAYTLDLQAPTISARSPAASATSVAVNSTVTVTFSESMTSAQITDQNFNLEIDGGATIAGAVSYNSGTRVATFTPSSNLANNTVYRATVTTGVTDASGNALGAQTEWTFTTIAAVPCSNASNVGDVCTEGGIYAGQHTIGGTSYKFMSTPGGCNNSAAPTCAGTEDTLALRYIMGTNLNGTSSTSDGPYNTARLVTISPGAAAAHFCSAMVYANYDDWYLPASDELNTVLYANKNAIGGFAALSYWSSTEASGSLGYTQSFSTGTATATTKSTTLRVRCIRKY